MNTSARRKQSTSVEEMVAAATRRSTRTVESEVPDISGNTFHAIIFDEKLAPTEKKKEIAKALVFAGTKEEVRARVAEFEEFKEFLQANREQMASEIIALTNTETFAQLKNVYEDMNGSLIDFEEKMKPLTDILEAVYNLRSNGTTLDVFRSINDDRKREAELSTEFDSIVDVVYEIEKTIDDLSYEIAAHAEEKSFFGFGGVKEEARQAIAVKGERVQQLRAELDVKKTRLDELKNEIAALSSSGEFADEKVQLRKLLDISSDDHKKNQVELVQAATSFVQTSKARIGEVREHLGDMSSKIENLSDGNQTLTRIYAILNESVKEAATENETIRSQYEPAAPDEDLITKMKREEEKRAVEDHIKVLNTTAVDTLTTFSDLTSSAIRIKSMKDNNDDQVNRAKMMHTQGIAGVADKLSVVLQAVSQAALGESSEMAKATLHSMSQQTNDIAKKEVIRAAIGVSAQNKVIEQAVESLASYGDTIGKATEISRQGLSEMRTLVEELEQTAAKVQDDIKEASAVTADATRKGSTKKGSTKASSSLGRV